MFEHFVDQTVVDHYSRVGLLCCIGVEGLSVHVAVASFITELVEELGFDYSIEQLQADFGFRQLIASNNVTPTLLLAATHRYGVHIDIGGVPTPVYVPMDIKRVMCERLGSYLFDKLASSQTAA